MPGEFNTKGLGQVYGLCACYDKPTLNGRPYDEIYKRILNGADFRFNEMMRRGGILCELGHPNQTTADFERTETDPSEACAIITKIEEKENGKIYATATILDTPKGRIYKALEPFYKFGFSSRGSYDLDENSIEGPNGWNQDSYVFKGFDLVALPANEGSEISALEGLGSKRLRTKTVAARESLDLKNIADAANVDPEEVEAELDKLFDENGELPPVDYIDIRDVEEDKTTIDENGKPMSSESSILLDLHKAISDRADLEKQVQKLLFEKAESESSILALRQQVADLDKIKRDADEKLAYYEKSAQDVQSLVDELVQRHSNDIDSISKVAEEEKKRADSLAKQVIELSGKLEATQEEAEDLYDRAAKQEEDAAKLVASEEQVSQLQSEVATLTKSLNAANTSLHNATEQLTAAKKQVEESKKAADSYKKMALAARESLVDVYSTVYSIDKRALMSKIGTSGDAKAIKSAAESLSRDALRLSGYSTSLAYAAVESTASNKPILSIKDDVDRELLEALKKEGKI